MLKQKYTPLLFILLFVLTFVACNQHKERKGFIPDEYRLPLNKIGDGKIYVYMIEGDSKDTFFTEERLVTESGTQYIIIRRYSTNLIFDSLKVTLNGKTVEGFFAVRLDSTDYQGHLVQAKIIDDTVLNNGTKLGKRVYDITYSSPNTIASLYTMAGYLKDTVLPWQGKPTDCIEIKMDRTFEVSQKLKPLTKRTTKWSGEIYCAKGVGIIMFTRRNDGIVITNHLVEIRDIKPRH